MILTMTEAAATNALAALAALKAALKAENAALKAEAKANGRRRDETETIGSTLEQLDELTSDVRHFIREAKSDIETARACNQPWDAE